VRSSVRTLLGAGTSSSTEFCIADAEKMCLSVQGSSKVTVSLANDPLSYSVISAVPAGIYGIEPGARWLKVQRTGSATTVLLNWSY